MNIQNKSIDDLIPYVNNPRDNSAAVDAVASSIAEFGFKVPIIVDRNNVVVTGHTRLLAAKKLGMTEVPVVTADDLTDAQIKAFRIADNKVAEIATWNTELLQAELNELNELDFDMSGFGFGDEVTESVDGVTDGEIPDIDETVEPTTKEGDLYKLGEHYLLCGDSTKAEDVQRLTGGEQVDLLLTDPPYNVDYTGGTEEQLKIKNDNLSDRDFYLFLFSAFSAADTVLKKGGAFYIWHAHVETINFYSAVADIPTWRNKQQLIWVKNSLVLGRSDYQWQHEPCIYGTKEGATHYFVDARNETTVIEDRVNLNKLGKDELKELCKQLMEQKVETTILREDKPSKNDIHPTMKPVKLFARLIVNSTKKGQKVLDIFGGSGTTIMACEQLGRKGYAMELDPRYCDAIVKRWEELTGKKAELISQKESDDGEDTES